MSALRFNPAVRRVVLCALALFALRQTPIASVVPDTLPASLSDQDFWALTERFSEPNGYFVSNSGSPDNLLSNENTLSTVAGLLAQAVRPGGVYLGVGPEQNFTYIAAMRPKIAFITDIRRGNLNLHLVYKAIFDMSATRADFITRLFSRKRPADLTTSMRASDLMRAFLQAEPIDEPAFQANLKAVLDRLTKTRGFALSADDLTGVEYVYRHYHRFGPAIHYTSSISGRSGGAGSYATIMGYTDAATGVERSYLANEENFALIKAMESKNLIVPLVGDFAGPKALRSLGAWLKEHGAVASAFYVSNVEQYLQRNNVWETFCANVAALPLDAASIFIRPGNARAPFSSMQSETARCK